MPLKVILNLHLPNFHWSYLFLNTVWVLTHDSQAGARQAGLGSRVMSRTCLRSYKFYLIFRTFFVHPTSLYLPASHIHRPVGQTVVTQSEVGLATPSTVRLSEAAESAHQIQHSVIIGAAYQPPSDRMFKA